ncbi:VOC family protein [Flavitalea sp.]|nr:VOC family protein [Flavitalea sp.]
MSITSKQNIAPHLWFNDRAEEAIRFYTGLFPNSTITNLKKWGPGTPFPENLIMIGTFVIDGLAVQAFDAGPEFTFNESVSFVVSCKTQAEIDKYWYQLTEDGGQESQCGWVKDKFGFSWQIVPEMLVEKLNGEPARAARMFQAVMKMKKLNIRELEDAYNM